MADTFDKIIEKLNSERKSSILIEYLKRCTYLQDDNNATIICSGGFQAEYIRNEISDINKYLNEILKKKVHLSVKVDKKFSAETADIDFEKEENEVVHSSEETIDEAIEHKKTAEYKKSNLNKNYRFENFIVGQNNQYLFSAATTVALEAGGKYNPFYVYGTVGIGKTHILQAIGNRYFENNKHKAPRILYVHSADFRSEFINTIREKKAYSFESKYKNIDMLLLDDLQLLENAEQTSGKLFDIFQELDSKGKQMVFVSDKPPMELQNIETRLKNRFEKSLVISIEPPQLETRIAIIEHKLEELDVSMSADIVNFMAENITTDVRKIEGALKSFLIFKDLKVSNPSLSDCIEQGIFENYITNKKTLKNSSVKDIIKIVADYYGISLDLLKGRDRTKYTSKVRHVAMYLVSEYSGKSTVEIGTEFGRDHASVIFARDKIRDEIKSKSQISREIEAIIASL